MAIPLAERSLADLYSLGLLKECHDRIQEKEYYREEFELYFLSIKTQFHLGNLTEVIKELNFGRETWIGNDDSLFKLEILMVKTLIRLGKIDEALTNMINVAYLEKRLSDINHQNLNYFSASSNYCNGLIYSVLGDFDISIRLITDAIIVFESQNSDEDTFSCYIALSKVYREKSVTKKAILAADKALNLAKSIRNVNYYAQALNNQGLNYLEYGEGVLALDNFEEGLSLFESIGNEFGISICSGNIGSVFLRNGDLSRAFMYLTRSLEIEINLGNLRNKALTLELLATIFQMKDDFVLALEYQRLSIEIFEELSNVTYIARSLSKQGMIHWKMGNLHEALNNLKTAHYYAINGNNKIVIAEILYNLVYVNVTLNEVDVAERHLQEFNALIESENNQKLISIHNLAKATISINSDRLSKRFQAMEFLKSVIKDKKVDVDLMIMANLRLFELLLFEYHLSPTHEIKSEIERIQDNLTISCKNINSDILFRNIKTLQLIFRLYTKDIDGANIALNQIREIEKQNSKILTDIGINETLSKLNNSVMNLPQKMTDSHLVNDLFLNFVSDHLSLLNNRKRDTQLLAHDINNLLTLNSINVHLALNSDPKSPEIRDFLSQIKKSSQDIGELIKSFNNDLEKFQTTKTEIKNEITVNTIFVSDGMNFDLKTLLLERLDRYNYYLKSNNKEFKINLPESCIVKTSNKLMLTRIIDNLIKNAIDHGTLSEVIEVNLDQNEKNAVVEIINARDIIPKSMVESIFEPNIQIFDNRSVKSEYRGLGLYYCKTAIEKLNGRIELISPLEDKKRGVMVLLSIPK